jgi:predicted transcriptional regulator
MKSSTIESLCDLLFEVSNDDRLSILQELNSREMNVTSIARTIQITTQEVSRHLSRLTEVGLTEKDPDGPYRLTPFGKLTLIQIGGLEFTSTHKNYFRDHSVNELPRGFILRLGELSRSRFINDIMVVVHNIEKIIKEADEYLLDINVPYIASAFPHIREAFLRGVKGRFLHSKDIVIPDEMMEEREEFFDEEFNLMVNRKGIYKEKISEVPLILYMSEKELALLSFPKRDRKFDFYGFTSTDKEAIKWCRDLFEHYWEKGSPYPSM